MDILGLNAYHGDSSACLVRDGKLVAAAEEERFCRVKHWAGLPVEAVRYCLNTAKIGIRQIDHIAVNRNPRANILHKLVFAASKIPSIANIRDRVHNALKVRNLRTELCRAFRVDDIRATINNIEHHFAHLGSSFYVSPYDSATVISIDGFGDFVSTMWGIGNKNRISVIDQVRFPHSLGHFYLSITQFLGFMNYGDEYKVMGLAPYGKPTEMNQMRKLLQLKPNGKFELNLDYFIHHSKGVFTIEGDNAAPDIGPVYSDSIINLFGYPRKKDEPITQRHQNIAASLQEMYEEAFFHILNHVFDQTHDSTLCLAGGCAMNSVANGKIFDRTRFKNLYVQSAAGDAGGAVGAAFSVWHQILGQPRSFVMDHAFWGPEFSHEEIHNAIQSYSADIKSQDLVVEYIFDENELCQRTATKIAEGKVIGWFHGRMEWGPRALGNRSIICDPRRNDMKNILNMKIKRRESFRPFAPSILREAVADWFETDYDVPFMLQVYQIRQDRQSQIPAVTHVNGSGRLQTVAESQNRNYYKLIQSFNKITGVPIVLNTSFNENEPVVCSPYEALDCFLRTQMDVLVLGQCFIERQS